MKRNYLWEIIVILLTHQTFLIPAKPKPVNLDYAKQRIIDYYEDGRYEKDLRKATSRAWNYFKKIQPGKNDVVIFDVDDTALSTYKAAKKYSFTRVLKFKPEWISQAIAPAINQVKELYHKLLKKGFKIIFLTGRVAKDHEATIKNLNNQGFVDFEELITRSPQEEKLKAVDYKTAHHKELARQGYRIVGCIGDQWSDLHGKTCGHTVKLPNYMYITE